MKPSKEVSSWIIILVVLLTAFITSAAMLKYKPSPDMNAGYYYPPQQVAQHLSPGVAAMRGGWQLAAGMNAIPAGGGTAPPIRAGAVPPHGDRGACITCHTVLGSGQVPVPPIQATAAMPHEYRGNCTNCHRLFNPNGLVANTATMHAAMPLQGAMPIQTAIPMRPATPMQYAMPVAAMTPQAAAPQLIPPPMTIPPTTARPATEGEWLGMEVSPITPLTARQYGIPDGTQGLVVAEVEVQAATVGIKAGDVIVSVNGIPTPGMTSFLQVTNNGTMPQGVVDLFRKGQRMTFNLSQTATRPAAGVPNNRLAAAPPTGVPAAMTPATTFPTTTYPATTPAAMPIYPRTYSMPPPATGAWQTGQGTGMVRNTAPGTAWPR